GELASIILRTACQIRVIFDVLYYPHSRLVRCTPTTGSAERTQILRSRARTRYAHSSECKTARVGAPICRGGDYMARHVGTYFRFLGPFIISYRSHTRRATMLL